jgi:hypothetical protein
VADERNPKLSQHYRELGADEPPHQVDQSILQAARRAPAARHRWYFALGAAAIVMLAAGITVHIERQRPDAEAVSRDSAPASAAPQSRTEPMAEARIDSPESWLERIVQLRKEGRQEAADKQLAEFRLRYPGYKVPEAALKKAK